ncbi:MAG: hypothetical protein JWL59_3829 [Chthoniobacteraceae bacterium]|nr:hypothetical protein [Chthoniobacteraceae bacterium]
MREETILILAPSGKRTESVAAALATAGLHSEFCADIVQLVRKVGDRCGALLVAGEFLHNGASAALKAALDQQDTWSDLPLVVLGEPGGRGHHILELFGQDANVTLLANPVQTTTLVSTLQLALRARRRQFEFKNLVRERDRVLASIGDAFAMIDREWRFVYANEKIGKICGLLPKELTGRNVWEILPNSAGTDIESQLRAAMESCSNVEFEWLSHGPIDRWFSFHAYPCHAGLSVYIVETTEEKRLKSILEESERRLHLALDSSNLGMWFCDVPLKNIAWDANCRRHFGVAHEEKVSFKRFFALLHPDDRARVQRAVTASMNECRPYDIEYRVVHPDGKIIWIHAIGRTYRDESGQPWRFDGVTINISAHKEAELEMIRAQSEAIRANRTKDQFLATLSHELRTPLTPVLMTVSALRDEPEISCELKDDLDLIHRNIKLEAHLIDDLLDLTRISRGKLVLHRETFDLHELLEYAIDASCTKGIDSKRLRIEFRAEASRYYVFADSSRIQQVFTNLLNNAVKFTPDGGKITITTRNPVSGQIEISVQDSGIGIAPPSLARLFDAFEQADDSITRRFGGLGLGLAISKVLIDLHGGSIRAESQGHGTGAVFTVGLRVAPVRKIVQKGRRPSAESCTRSLRILLTEDHQPTRETLTKLLTRAGHEVHSAGTVADALQIAGEHPFDLLLSDVGLPDASGNELMRQIHESYHLPGIALTGFGMEDDIAASRAAGFSIHLTKPVDWKQLQRALINVSALA